MDFGSGAAIFRSSIVVAVQPGRPRGVRLTQRSTDRRDANHGGGAAGVSVTGCRAADGKGRPAAQKSRSNELTDGYRVTKHCNSEKSSWLVYFVADLEAVRFKFARHPVLFLRLRRKAWREPTAQ